MRTENIKITSPEAEKIKIVVEKKYASVAPAEFKKDPLGYFEREGKNIKSGEVKYGEGGQVKDDPTAVKDLPSWTDTDGREVAVVGKKVNVNKGEVGKSGEPFWEYKILQLAEVLGLPAARPIAMVEQGGDHLIVMEKVSGLRFGEVAALKSDLTEEDTAELYRQAEEKIKELAMLYSVAGINRKWHPKDMVFQIDFGARKIISVTPTDWERTKVDWDKVRQFGLAKFQK